MSDLNRFSYLKSINADFIDDVYGQYLASPESVDPTWRYFFEGLEMGSEFEIPLDLDAHAQPGQATGTTASSDTLLKEARVYQLIQAYRQSGKWIADINPLTPAPSSHADLELSRFGLTTADLTQKFAIAQVLGFSGATALSEIIASLKLTYCSKIAVEIEHIQNREALEWIRSRIESTRLKPNLDPATQKFVLERLSQSEGFERFLHTRYVGVKRFSIEGGESAIPALDSLIEKGTELGAQEFVLGMAHRGRLNVLTQICGKPWASMFTEFEGNYKADLSHGEGDVKYHKGYSSDLKTRSGKSVHLSLSPNPSHLEFVYPVVLGMTRAKQQKRGGDSARNQVIPIAIHGDAAFAGQGVCYEALNFAQLKGYSTGGAIHLVINNQVGFTADPDESRSTPYCTDLAKMLDAPIFHVNGDDPESVWLLSQLAIEYRQKFKGDVFIDLVCYRKYGHNEGDEPAFTQPILTKKIKAHPSTREIYAQKLTTQGSLPAGAGDAIVEDLNQKFIAAQQVAKKDGPYASVSTFEGLWKGLHQPHDDAEFFVPVATAVEENRLKDLSVAVNMIPGHFTLNSKLGRFFEARIAAVKSGAGIDWGNAESLAYATLLEEGHCVRVSGQDAGRGTFTHRHSMLHDAETGEVLFPLNAASKNGSRYEVYNSHLSETGVLAFEYGYGSADPSTLTIWEAQFGDFANGAQVIIDQFIATSESKWQRMNGLVLLLPHGYEGQGPEHSSARLERFLQLCALQNLTVTNLTTPAQIFHALRRQIKRKFRKPLVVMSPKSLLRHPMAISTLADLSQGGFQEVLDDPSMADANLAKKAKRVLLCSGKVYYDLVNERTARKLSDVAIVRIEQLYPWPEAKLAAILARYSSCEDFVWVQEEPRNMGAWQYIFGQWMGGLGEFNRQVGSRPIRYVGRDLASAPAVGSPKIHEQQLKNFLEQAFKA